MNTLAKSDSGCNSPSRFAVSASGSMLSTMARSICFHRLFHDVVESKEAKFFQMSLAQAKFVASDPTGIYEVIGHSVNVPSQCRPLIGPLLVKSYRSVVNY
jgi:hypothetical protein